MVVVVVEGGVGWVRGGEREVRGGERAFQLVRVITLFLVKFLVFCLNDMWSIIAAPSLVEDEVNTEQLINF